MSVLKPLYKNIGGVGDGSQIANPEDTILDPTIKSGDAGKIKLIKADESGWENVEANEVPQIKEKFNLQDGIPLSFHGELIREPFPNFIDPHLFDKSHFSDGEYRLIVSDPNNATNPVYKTSDFENYTQVIADAFSSTASELQMADAFVRSDGTFALYVSNDTSTDVWTGSDLTSLSKLGQAVSEPDCGVYYDEENSTVHIYTEDADNASGVGSGKLSHWTTSDDDLLNATQQADAVDVTSKSWKTGDPDVVKYGSKYYMFTDNTANHPDYRIAVFESNDLDNWTLIQEEMAPNIKGGDMVLVQAEDASYFHAFTEYSGADQYGVAYWKVWPAILNDSSIVKDNKHVFVDRSTGEHLLELIKNGTTTELNALQAVKFVLNALNATELDLQVDGKTFTLRKITDHTLDINQGTVFRLRMNGEFIYFINDSGNLKIEVESGKVFSFGIQGTGAAEVVIDDSGANPYTQLNVGGTPAVHLGSAGNIGFGGVIAPKEAIHNGGAYRQNALSSDPSDPPAGETVQWVSDGTESGAAGDVMRKINVAGTVKTVTEIDFSAS